VQSCKACSFLLASRFSRDQSTSNRFQKTPRATRLHAAKLLKTSFFDLATLKTFGFSMDTGSMGIGVVPDRGIRSGPRIPANGPLASQNAEPSRDHFAR
jgi:hypothetical protein